VQDKSTAQEVLRRDHFKEMMSCYPIIYLYRAGKLMVLLSVQ